jgi:hypothetical protein
MKRGERSSVKTIKKRENLEGIVIIGLFNYGTRELISIARENASVPYCVPAEPNLYHQTH